MQLYCIGHCIAIGKILQKSPLVRIDFRIWTALYCGYPLPVGLAVGLDALPALRLQEARQGGVTRNEGQGKKMDDRFYSVGTPDLCKMALDSARFQSTNGDTYTGSLLAELARRLEALAGVK